MRYTPNSDPVLHGNVLREIDILRARIAKLESAVRSAARPHPSPYEAVGTDASVAYSLASNVTLTQGDMLRRHVVNCTSASDMTLPTAANGRWVTIENYGSADITIKNPAGTAIGTVKQYQWTKVEVVGDSGGVPSWPSGLVVQGAQGSLYMAGEIISRDDTKGFQWKDSAGHWWRGTINTSGALVTADLGTTESAPTEPPL